MPKRLLWFLILLILMFGLNVVAPIFNRLELESKSTNTSLSTLPSGYKALYRLLQVVDKNPVGLWQHSMMLMPLTPKTIWFMEPGEELYFIGPRYAQGMRSLVLAGNNLIFVVSAYKGDHMGSYRETFRTLEKWYGISLRVSHKDYPETLAVKSYFPSRRINTLVYKHPVPVDEKKKKNFWRKKLQPEPQPYLLTFQPFSKTGGFVIPQVLLETESGEALACRYKIGRGSVTVVLNGSYFSNGHLKLADNAPLAIALAETNVTPQTWFEVYSAGFHDNRDLMTYLATGKGITLLISLGLFLVLSCTALVNQPIRQTRVTSTLGQYTFTQEVFIDSLANLYLETRDYNALYAKLAGQFRLQIERRQPGMAFDAQLELLARNPYYGIAYDDLKACFATSTTIGSRQEFVKQSHRLLTTQGKVNQYG